MGWWNPLEYARILDPIDWPRPMPGDWMASPYMTPVASEYHVRAFHRDVTGIQLVVCGKIFDLKKEALDYAKRALASYGVDSVEVVQKWTPEGMTWYYCPIRI